ANRQHVPSGDRTTPTARGTSRQLRLDQYEGQGGLVTMLSNHADRLMSEILPANDRSSVQVFELLFRALTDTNAEGHGIRKPQRFDKLCAITGAGEDLVRAIVDRFRADGASFLTPYMPLPIGPKTVIDISHEALIRSWTRISDPSSGWLQSEFRDGQD